MVSCPEEQNGQAQHEEQGNKLRLLHKVKIGCVTFAEHNGS
jgi:hypothetical protein